MTQKEFAEKVESLSIENGRHREEIFKLIQEVNMLKSLNNTYLGIINRLSGAVERLSPK